MECVCVPIAGRRVLNTPRIASGPLSWACLQPYSRYVVICGSQLKSPQRAPQEMRFIEPVVMCGSACMTKGEMALGFLRVKNSFDTKTSEAPLLHVLFYTGRLRGRSLLPSIISRTGIAGQSTRLCSAGSARHCCRVHFSCHVNRQQSLALH